MDNKLGLCHYKLKDVEKKIVNLKLNLLDESFSFDCDIFSFKYLINLNKFLFEDIYDLNSKSIICNNKIEYDYLEFTLKKLEKSVQKGEIDEILILIEEIWHYQPFIIGNTRTMIAYLKVLNDSFLLDIPINVNANIESNPKMFKLKNMLTKKS